MSTRLPTMDHAGRLDRLRVALERRGLAAVLVTSLVNVRYLSGFTGSAGVLLVTGADVTLVTDSRYELQAADELAVPASLEITRSPEEVLSPPGGQLALEADDVSWARQRAIAGWFPEVELVPTTGLVEDLRRTKDAGELARIGAAARIADDALASVVPVLGERPTERAFATELDAEVRRRGADGAAYETIVASGPNAALPHACPGDRVIQPGDLVVVDVGAVVDGYRSDMTRTFCVGEASAAAQAMRDAVLEAHEAGVAAVGVDVEVAAVDRATRDVLSAAGLADDIRHATGHGVGLEIHEPPILSLRVDARLAADAVVTVEPGAYRKGLGGVRIEDLLVVEPDGARRLTHHPKDFVVPVG